MKKIKKFNLKKLLKKTAKGLFRLTLIPYGIATYKELKTVDWMTYWQTVKVAAFVILFSVVTASLVYGVDQIISKCFYFINK
ncbi:MAG: preprotein translocase subunit SecE [bacterium]